MKTGLVLGKFAPLHRGHQFLIEQALKQVDRLYVLIYESPEITDIPGLKKRIEWIRQLYPQVFVLEGWAAPSVEGHSTEIMREQEAYIMRMIPEKITHFFSSEWYGEHVSIALGAKDVRVDADRIQVPISGTSARLDAFAQRHFIHPLVYRDLVQQVVFLGAESTGRTTLAEALAKEYDTVWMPEHGREYWIKNRDAEGRLTPEQLVDLAKEHLHREDDLIGEANRFFFIDTNALTTARFCHFYHGFISDELESLAVLAQTRYDTVIVYDDDIVYEDDGTRSGALHRQRFQQEVLLDLIQRGVPYRKVCGSLPSRIELVKGILGRS